MVEMDLNSGFGNRVLILSSARSMQKTVAMRRLLVEYGRRGFSRLATIHQAF